MWEFDLGDSETPYQDLERFLFKEIALKFLKPAYDRGEYVLLHVYYGGHGYMDPVSKESLILLNTDIRWTSLGFLNPYPI